MKTKRQIFFPMVLIVVLFFGFVLLVGISTGQAFAAEEFFEDSVAVVSNEESTPNHVGVDVIHEALDRFRTSVTDEGGEDRIEYADTFAGWWQGGDIWKIGIAADDSYVDMLNSEYSFGGQVGYVRREFSWNQLLHIQNALLSLEYSSTIRMGVAFARRYENDVFVLIPNMQQRAIARDILTLQGLYNPDAITFSVGRFGTREGTFWTQPFLT